MYVCTIKLIIKSIANNIIILKVTEMVISNYYLSLSGKVKSKFIQDVIELCDISYPSFFYKMRNDSWTKLEREAIEKFIQQKNEKSN